MHLFFKGYHLLEKEKQDTNKLSGFFWLFNELYWKTFFKEPWENVENLDFHRKMALKMKRLLIKQKQFCEKHSLL